MLPRCCRHQRIVLIAIVMMSRPDKAESLDSCSRRIYELTDIRTILPQTNIHVGILSTRSSCGIVWDRTVGALAPWQVLSPLCSGSIGNIFS